MAPIESFTRFQLAAIIDFHRFPEISWIFMDFMMFMDALTWSHAKERAVAPIESFTRFQLAAIIDFHGFHDFMDFHGSGSEHGPR